MPLVFDHPSVPPAGFDFKDPSGVTINAPSARKLIEKIAQFRLANGKPKGNPHAEVEADYRVRYPWLVSKVGATPETPEDPVSKWLNRAWKSPIKEREFADSTVIEERLSICKECEHCVTHVYAPEAKRRMAILGCGRVTNMSACSVHHWPVGLAALHQTHDTPLQVDGCWVARKSP
jgi:hypothetical protein